VEQGRVVGLNIAGIRTVYQGADRMNSLKHLDLPIMAMGLKDGDEVLSKSDNGSVRTLYLRANRLVGFQLVGDIKGAGVLRALIHKGDDLRRLKDRLLDPNFGQGQVLGRALTI